MNSTGRPASAPLPGRVSAPGFVAGAIRTARAVALGPAGALIAGLLLLAGCDGLPGRPRPEARGLPPTEVLDFDRLYAANCAGCHGAAGRLGAARPLNDPLYLALVPPARLRGVIADGVPGTLMPAHARHAGGMLTAAQVEALAAGLVARWSRPGAAGAPLPPYDAAEARTRGIRAGAPERGATVFAAACARCHGRGGRGSEVAGPVAVPTYLALVSDQHLRTTVIVGRSDLGKPDWRGDVPGQPLTPEQISDVVAWLASQRRPVRGRPAADAGPGSRAAARPLLGDRSRAETMERSGTP